MSSAKYMQEAVCNVEDYITRNLDGRKLKKNPTYSWPTNYTAEDDESPELPPMLASYYQHLIGILHWIVELGRVDLVTEVSLLASQMAMTEFRQPLQVQSHLEMPRILVQLGHTQRTWKLAPQTDPKWSPTWSLTRFQPICPLIARDERYSCQVSRAHRTHSRL